MKLCIAQTKPFSGDIPANVRSHLEFAQTAVSLGAELIVFPELSLTGYEPDLAGELAIDVDDQRLAQFQALADSGNIAIALGAPMKTDTKPHIGLVVFSPYRVGEVYCKRYLHSDEEPFFSAGENRDVALGADRKTAFAVCYEISVPQHAEDAFAGGAEIYAASVAKFASGIEKACDRMQAIARSYSAVASMSNCIGWADGQECAGRSSIWSDGELVAQLDDKREGLIIFDTNAGEAVTKYL